ncbi:short-chain dehydrogenase/reductase SDR [Hyaloraphidium curvatum]|nr:short-chain dehydrogenase/reductase SDR [Hyaloraphidium curvatum]
MGRLDGKLAVVTGSASPSSLGLAVAAAFLREGARVIVADLHPGASASLGPNAEFVKCDVTCDADLEALFARADGIGGADVLVCCAAAFVLKGADASRDEWDASFRVNVAGSARAAHRFSLSYAASGKGALVPRGKGGAVLLFASISGHIAQRGFACYASTKGAVLQLARSLALDLAPLNIRCNSVSPGTIFSAASERHMAAHSLTEGEFRAEEGGKCPLGRVGEPDEVAEAAVFLCSEGASYITGADLRVDGGITIV